MSWHPTLGDIEGRADGPATRPRPLTDTQRRESALVMVLGRYGGCWCGRRAGHRWPGREAGARHPRDKPGGQDMNAGDEQRRENHGWFGTPWWSWVCYDENGQLNTAMRKAFPAGESCGYCEVPFDEAAGDGGTAMPFTGVGSHELRHVHRECQFRQVAGGLAHHQKRCHCYGGEGEGTPGLSLREEALAVWALWSHGQAPGAAP